MPFQRVRCLIAATALLVAVPHQAGAQDDTPARFLFSRPLGPAPLATESIGSYARGCLAGAVALPVNGPTWQVMRLSRNRKWGHPDLIAFVERLAARARPVADWPGLLIGDLSQPRGGPMLYGHESHQIGLDVDIWLRPMPGMPFSRSERDTVRMASVLTRYKREIDPAKWSAGHAAIIRAAAEDAVVERVLVNPVIKRALCQTAGEDRTWLAKVRPWLGHDEHFHVRIACPADNTACEKQEPVPEGDGCGQELQDWFTPSKLPIRTRERRKALTLADLPAACREVLSAP